MKRILILSDNASDHELGETLQNFMKQYEFAWGSFPQSRANVLSFQPDAILMDIRFLRNNEDCWKVIRQVKADRLSSRILVLFAVNNDVEKIKGFEAGMDDYILAPFSPEVLAKKLIKELSIKSRDELIWGLYQASRQGEEALRIKMTSLLQDKVSNDPAAFSEILDAGLAHGEAERYKKCLIEINSMSIDENVKKIITQCLKAEEISF